jgi:hypothetical protein
MAYYQENAVSCQVAAPNQGQGKKKPEKQGTIGQSRNYSYN